MKSKNINELVELVKQWGLDRGITGPDGRGTPKAQANKMLEECNETRDAVLISVHQIEENGYVTGCILDEIKDGIGDLHVTAILLAEMHGFTTEQCLQAAYDEIAGRTGKMIGGQFVKDK